MIEVRFQTKITLNLCYILAPLLLAASRACSMSLCQTFFFKLLLFLQLLTDFSHQTWHTWSMCQYAQNCGTDFQNFDFKNFGKFL